MNRPRYSIPTSQNCKTSLIFQIAATCCKENPPHPSEKHCCTRLKSSANGDTFISLITRRPLYKIDISVNIFSVLNQDFTVHALLKTFFLRQSSFILESPISTSRAQFVDECTSL